MLITSIIILLGIISASMSGVLPTMFNSVSAQEGSIVEVSIVPGASTLTDTAFDPNPVDVKVGDTVKWTNNDNVPHTVIEGSPSTSTGEVVGGFASEIFSPGTTFEITFNQTGTFEYYCSLHPGMVGTVNVS